jgi:hypothetical protein
MAASSGGEGDGAGDREPAASAVEFRAVPEVASGRSRRAIGARGAEQRSHGWLGKASLAPTATCSSTGKTGMGAARQPARKDGGDSCAGGAPCRDGDGEGGVPVGCGGGAGDEKASLEHLQEAAQGN